MQKYDFFRSMLSDKFKGSGLGMKFMFKLATESAEYCISPTDSINNRVVLGIFSTC